MMADGVNMNWNCGLGKASDGTGTRADAKVKMRRAWTEKERKAGRQNQEQFR